MRTLLFLILLAIIGWLTMPGHQKFTNYLDKKEKSKGACIEATRVTTYKIFSLGYADYCRPDGPPRDSTDTSIDTSGTRKFLGLFGTFWKLPN